MHGLSLGIIITLLITSFISLTVGFVDVCKTNYLTLPFAGDRGLIGVTDSLGPTGNVPCILRLQGCSQCRITLHPVGDDWYFPPCPSSSNPGQYSLKECIPGCSYLFVFDSIYLNETLRFYDNSAWPGFQFKSISSAVFVGLCSHQSPPNITLNYNIDPNTVTLSSSMGHVRSPNFPYGYVQNGDVYTWVIKNTEFSKILVVFDDWHISPFVGEIFFDEDDNNRRRPINGSMSRPVVITQKPELRVIFSTGNHFLEDQNRYMGFKFTYTFYREGDPNPKINTDCGKNYLINSGGVIDFQLINSVKDHQYDCTWIIKKQPNFDKVYMKIIKFREDDLLSHSNQEVVIHKGLTSDGRIMDKVYANSFYKDPYFSETGFYIRFKGLVRPMDNLQIVFTSYRERGYSDCNNQGMFYCGTQRCIPSDLKCDRFNHCGDNSDESNSHCISGGAGWSRSSNYTMTVSVIVPLVISVFLLVILCVLFFLIRRCHKARAQEFDRDVGIIPTISAGIGRRRRQRNRQARRPADFPPTYEEALENPPYEEPPLRYDNEVLKPPSYNEATGQFENVPPDEEYVEEDYPPPEFSTIDRSRPNSYITPTANSEEIRPVNHSHSMSYSSESSTEIPANRIVSQVNSPPYTEVPPERLRTSHREQSREEEEYMERTSSQPKVDRPTESRSSRPTRAKNDMGQELERKRMDNRTEPAVVRGDKTSREKELLSHSKNTGKDGFRERHSLPDTSSRTESQSKAGKFHKDEQLWKEGNQRRPKEEWRSRASDNSSNGLLFSEEHFTDRENRGILNQAFKDFDQSSLNSPPRTNSASLANLSSLERWTDDRRGMAMSLQQLPTTHCVASSDIRASDRTDLPRRTLTANQRHSSTSASQEVIGNQQHLQPTNRNISLSVGNLPAYHHNLQHLNREQDRPERAHNPSHRSVSLGDLNRRVNSQNARRQAHSQADLSNIQEERSPDSIVFACDNEDIFV